MYTVLSTISSPFLYKSKWCPKRSRERLNAAHRGHSWNLISGCTLASSRTTSSGRLSLQPLTLLLREPISKMGNILSLSCIEDERLPTLLKHILLALPCVENNLKVIWIQHHFSLPFFQVWAFQWLSFQVISPAFIECVGLFVELALKHKKLISKSDICSASTADHLTGHAQAGIPRCPASYVRVA